MPTAPEGPGGERRRKSGLRPRPVRCPMRPGQGCSLGTPGSLLCPLGPAHPTVGSQWAPPG